MVTTTTGDAKGVWGTWEELILGGAVLRHGLQAWDVVSSEVQARTVSPRSFTPEACKNKYEDLQKQYIGCNSLESKLKSLKAENREKSGEEENTVPKTKGVKRKREDNKRNIQQICQR